MEVNWRSKKSEYFRKEFSPWGTGSVNRLKNKYPVRIYRTLEGISFIYFDRIIDRKTEMRHVLFKE